MKYFALFSILLSAASGSCARPAPLDVVIHVPEEEKPLSLLELYPPAVPCFTLKDGPTVATDGTTPCIDEKVAAQAFAQVKAKWKASSKDARWNKTTVVLIAEIPFDCDGTAAAGCTQMVPTEDGQYVSIVSMGVDIFGPRVFKHELQHLGILFGDYSKWEHFCLDEPGNALCQD